MPAVLSWSIFQVHQSRKQLLTATIPVHVSFLQKNGDAVEEEGTAKSLPPAGRRELLRDGNWTP